MKREDISPDIQDSESNKSITGIYEEESKQWEDEDQFYSVREIHHSMHKDEGLQVSLIKRLEFEEHSLNLELSEQELEQID